MRIGLFTDTYRPSINGVVYVVESLKKHLEAMGHEVYVFCPARSIKADKYTEEFAEDKTIIRFPSFKGAFYDDYDTSIFFPPVVLSRIKDLNLDVIHFLDPGQVGMMGVYAAHKLGIPLVAQHSTDLRQYVEHYRDSSLLPGLLALLTLLPLTMKVQGRDLLEIAKLYKPRRDSVEWNISIVERIITMIYSKCDVVIALSRKSKKQLESWQNDDYHYPVTLLPSGVDPLPRASEEQISEFRAQYGIAKDDLVFGFVGRLGAEKNLDLLIDAFARIVEHMPDVRLLFTGDFEYREQLEKHAEQTSHPEHVIFTGALPRETLGTIYGAMDVFAFPSLTDTQGWVLHEAAHTGLPLVLVDKDLSEVIHIGENGYYAENNPGSVASAVSKLLSDPKKRKEFGAASKKIAAEFTESQQIEKLVQLYERAIKVEAPNATLFDD